MKGWTIKFSSISRRIPWKRGCLILPSQAPYPFAPGITWKEKVFLKNDVAVAFGTYRNILVTSSATWRDVSPRHATSCHVTKVKMTSSPRRASASTVPPRHRPVISNGTVIRHVKNAWSTWSRVIDDVALHYWPFGYGSVTSSATWPRKR